MSTRNLRCARDTLIVVVGTLLVASCGGGGSTPQYTVGGTISGLVGSGLVLQDNGGKRKIRCTTRLEPVVWVAAKATRQRSIEFREMSNGNSSSLRPARPIACFAPIARPNERTREVILLFVVYRTCSTQRAYSGSSAAYELS